MTSPRDLAAMQVMVLSVPHTGTRFAKRMLEHRVKVRPVHTTDDADVIAAHIEASAHVVLPVRNPDHCWEGWRKRNTGDADKFVRAWHELQRWADRLEEAGTPALLLPIDHPQRESFRQTLCDVLGTNLPADWRPVGQKEALVEYEPAPDVWDLPIVSRFYAVQPRGAAL